MVRGEEAWRRRMERCEVQKADTDNGGRDKEAPAAGGDTLGQRPRRPPHGGGGLLLDLTRGQDDPPGGATGGGGDDR
jgi:hypothetical protein